MKAPSFWDKEKSIWVTLLKPASFFYALATRHRVKKKGYKASIPVICVGNIFVGGVGKTPVSIALGRLLHQKDKNFYYLNHGYKADKQCVVVDQRAHTALDVGDEALLLNEIAPTVVSSKRVKGAKLAEKWGARALIMDDGFQNPSLVKDFSFVVVDGKKGFGNEKVLPAGPLREPVLEGLKRAQAIVLVGEDTWGVRFYLNRLGVNLPIVTGHFELDETVVSLFKGQRVFAFAGLGRPQKFYKSLEDAGIQVVRTEDFPDHYYYTRFDIEVLKRKAEGLPLLTTEKDGVKLPKDVRQNIFVMPGQFIFDEPEQVWNLLQGVFNVPDSSSETSTV